MVYQVLAELEFDPGPQPLHWVECGTDWRQEEKLHIVVCTNVL